MKLTIVESPYAGDVEANTEYARRALADTLARGEAPFASHLLYTQPGVLDDLVPAERTLGIEAGLAWGDRADLTALYVDRGISTGMLYGVHRAILAGRPIQVRGFDGAKSWGLALGVGDGWDSFSVNRDVVLFVDRHGDGKSDTLVREASNYRPDARVHVVSRSGVWTRE